MRVLLAAMAVSLLAGCTATSYQQRATGIGSGPNALKRTPCACIEKAQPAGLPEFLKEAGDATAGVRS